MLSQLAITEFKQIYQDEFGVELSEEEATGKAINVFNLVKAMVEFKARKLDNDLRKCHHEN